VNFAFTEAIGTIHRTTRHTPQSTPQ